MDSLVTSKFRRLVTVMLTDYFSNLDPQIGIPSILVVGCGHVGSSVVKTIVDSAPAGCCSIFVTDSDKERARKLSEYRLSMITPIRWRYAHDTPVDVDLIVVAVDHNSEHKIIDRLALSKTPFVSLSDDASVFDSYEDYETEFIEGKIRGIVGAGLVPGISNVLANHCATYFDVVYDVVVERLGFVSSASLDSVKSARRDSPLCIRDGIPSDSKRDAGSSLSWFPPPYGLVQCQSVASGVAALAGSFPEAHNISVRFTEPKLPTFSERVRNIFLKVPLTTTRACIRVEMHGLKDGKMESRILAIVGDAMKIITTTCIMSIVGLHNFRDDDASLPFLNCGDVIDPKTLLNSLTQQDVALFRFDGNDY